MTCSNLSGMLLIFLKFYTISLIFLLFTLSLNIYALYNKKITNGPLHTEYDHIIVGAGTAGTTILDGLPENERVLLIDAGTMPNVLMNIPIIAPIIHGTQYNWGFRTIQQTKSCLALNDWSSNWSSGKGYGGSNIFNNMIANWGHEEDFRGWFGNLNDYNYTRDILPYFKQNINFPIVDKLHNITKFGEAILNIKQFNGLKFQRPNVYQKNGWRWSMANESYNRLKGKHEILTSALVTKIIFNQSNIAESIELILSNGDYLILKSRKSIILSAGTIGTPKILLQSGIGPCDELNKLGINCIKNLPVGKNLQDHISTGLDLITLDYNLHMNLFDLSSPKNLYNFFRYGKGPLSHCGCEAIGFYKNNNNLKPELGFMVMPVGITTDSGAVLRHIINLNNTWWNEYFQHIVNEGKQTVSILPILLHPKSRGTVRLRSKNPFDLPIIDPKYLNNQYDIDILINGLQLIDKIIYNSPELKLLGAKIYERPFPGCENYKFKTKLYWECYVKHLTLTVYHPIGTCSIDNVVTKEFRVKGIKNLFVVDGSVLKNLPSGNPNAVIAMIARRFIALRNFKLNNMKCINTKRKLFI